MASNPVFSKIEKDIDQGQYAGFGAGQQTTQGNNAPQGQYGYQQGNTQSAPGSVGGAWGAQPAQQQYPDYGQVQASGTDRPMTMDDVVMKFFGLFGLLLLTGVTSYFLVNSRIEADAQAGQQFGMTLWLGGMIIGLVLGLIIAFKKTVSVPLIVAYAAVEGVFVGAISAFYERQWDGIVGQAVLATACVFAGMFIGYRTGFIKVTEKSRRIFGMMLIGYVLFALVNFVLVMTGVLDGFGVGNNSWLGIGISIFAVGLASYSLAVDFDSIERGVQARIPEKYSWLMAHGLIVSVVWLYLEILRLLARLQQNN